MTDGSYVLSCITLLSVNIFKQFLHQNDPWDFGFLINMGALPSSPWLHFQNEGASLEWVKQIVSGVMAAWGGGGTQVPNGYPLPNGGAERKR